jgi:hypothetical protein
VPDGRHGTSERGHAIRFDHRGKSLIRLLVRREGLGPGDARAGRQIEHDQLPGIQRAGIAVDLDIDGFTTSAQGAGKWECSTSRSSSGTATSVRSLAPDLLDAATAPDATAHPRSKLRSSWQRRRSPTLLRCTGAGGRREVAALICSRRSGAPVGHKQHPAASDKIYRLVNSEFA